MEIWLKNDSYNIRFPVLPSEYTIGSQSNNTSVNVTNLSEVTLLGNRNLETVSFETFFPKTYESMYCDISPEHTPVEYRDIFEKMKQSGVCKLTLTGAGYSKKVTIESLEAKEDDGTGDITISFSFKEYVKPVVKVVSVQRAAVKVAASRTTKTTSSDKTYTVKSGDCLSRIAASQTGKASNWQTIYSDNKSVIGSNPNLIYPGQVYKIRASY